MSTTRRAAVLAILSITQVGLVRADDLPPGVRSAIRQINTEKKVIMAFMYPTVTLEGIEADAFRRTASGFELDVIFDYSDSNNNMGWVKLAMRFDTDGRVLSASATKWSDLWPPFGLAKLTLEAIKGSIRNDRNATAEAKKLLTINDPQVFLVEYLNAKTR